MLALAVWFLLIANEFLARFPWPGEFAMWRTELLAVFRSSDSQWLAFLVIGAYLIGGSWLATKRAEGHEKGTLCTWQEAALMLTLALWCAGSVVLDYPSASQTTDPLVLFTGITVFFWTAVVFRAAPTADVAKWGLAGLLCLASLSLKQWNHMPAYSYRGQRRWIGLWDNPNTLGLFMGMTFVSSVAALIAAAEAVQEARKRSGAHGLSTWYRWMAVLPAGVSLIGLMGSYSRGAWLGTAVGIAVVGFRAVTWLCSESSSLTASARMRLRQSLAPGLSISVALIVLCFWQMRMTDNRIVRRVFSVGNLNDFSWRNRLTAWQAALQMMADRPLSGWGWNRAEEAYHSWYQPSNLLDTTAIYTNDFLLLGTSMGIPALAVFASFLALRVNGRGEARDLFSHGSDARDFFSRRVGFADWWSVWRRACLWIFLTAMFFDGVFIRLSLAITFCVLLGLGEVYTEGNGGKLNKVIGMGIRDDVS
jgi:O-antigen ligase